MSKKFSLILGGGAARGLAHIGVIRRLQELHLVPHTLIGTSMGALIGAFYACGYTSADMEKIARDISFIKMLDIDMKRGGIKGKKILAFLEKYFGEKTFADTEIPLIIISTNLDTGREYVWQSGKIIDAIRASISIPGIFTPYEYDGMHLIDGGVVSNLPVEYAPGGIGVIAVSVQIHGAIVQKKSLLPFFSDGPFVSTYNTLRKTLQIIMQRNEEISLLSRDDIVSLRVGRNDIDYYEFQKVTELIEAGYDISESLEDNF